MRAYPLNKNNMLNLNLKVTVDLGEVSDALNPFKTTFKCHGGIQSGRPMVLAFKRNQAAIVGILMFLVLTMAAFFLGGQQQKSVKIDVRTHPAHFSAVEMDLFALQARGIKIASDPIASPETDAAIDPQNPSDNVRVAEQEPSSNDDEESLPPYHYIILEAATKHDMDPALIRAVIMAESANNPNAVSRSGAKGLMQLMPRTAKSLGVEQKNILDPEHNINGGVKYLRQLLDRFNGDIRLALAAYNAGSRYVLKYRGIPPFKETRAYIKKVLTFYETFRKEMSDNQEMA